MTLPAADSQPPRRSRRPWLLLAALLIIILALAIQLRHRAAELAASRGSEESAAAEAVNVVALVLHPTTMVDRLDLPATVTAWEDVTVKAEVGGRVTGVMVVEGEVVEGGQTLALIDRRDYENRLQSVAAQYALAKADFERLRRLIGQEAISKARFDEAEATLKELAAARADAELALERCTITAPIAGVVNRLPARVGLLLERADPAVQLLDISRLKVEAAIPEADVAAVRTLDQARVTFAALGNRRVVGRTTYLASQPESAAMAYTLQLAVDNPRGEILPGMFARVEIEKQRVEQALAVPLYAVIAQGDDRFVYVVDQGIARRRAVSTGFLDGWQIQVTEGLTAGEAVVVVGHRSLEDGQPVNVVNTVDDPTQLAP